MRMVEVKVAELEGAALDWAVAKAVHGVDLERFDTCCGNGQWNGNPNEPPECCGLPAKTMHLVPSQEWRPSVDWAQGGPLIERKLISLHSPCSSQGNTGHEGWNANCPVVDDPDFTVHEHWRWQAGATPLIAACRAIVAAKHGDTISIPAELVDS